MRRCRKCVMPLAETCGGGVCNLCKDMETQPRGQDHWLKQLAKLEEIVREARSPESSYDCIVPMSGGRDSAYVAYVMSKLLGLRILGVNLDNGYRSEVALRNLERLCGHLGITLVTLKPPPKLVSRIFAHFLRSTGYFCSACDAMGYIIIYSYVLAETKQAGRSILVVGGWSKDDEYQPGLSVLSMRDFGSVLMEAPSLYSTLRAGPLVNGAVFDKFIEVGDIRQLLPLMSTDSNAAGPLPRIIQLPDYWKWDYLEITKTLTEEVGLELPEGIYEAHTDCTLSPIQEYLKLCKYGVSQKTYRLSSLVRSGAMTRDEAIWVAEQISGEPPVVLEEILGEWDMSWEDAASNAAWSREADEGHTGSSVLGQVLADL